MKYFSGLFCLLLTCLHVSTAIASETPTLHVAVASNFLFPMQKLALRFEARTGIRIVTSSGSTGGLYAQISHGAPYDIFLSADKRRPQLLVEKGLGVKDSLVTYAVGQLVLWGNDRQIGDECLESLKKLPPKGRLAIANPQTAPYGTAAREVLVAMKLWDGLKNRTVYGNTVAFTFQFVDTNNVDFGIVAKSEYLRKGAVRPGCHWFIPEKYHTPLEQQAVILQRTEKKRAAQKFMAFLTGEQTRNFLNAVGYGTP